MKMLFKDELQFNEFAIEFSKNLKPSNIIILNGDLGVGKTTFVKAVARGLGIKKIVNSPTFSIIKSYENILCHVDAYRVCDEDIGLDFYTDQNFIVFIEWSENIKNYIPWVDYEINLNYHDEGREIKILKRS